MLPINKLELLRKIVIETAPECLEVAHYLSDHPEISGQEEQSCGFITRFLQAQGYTITSPWGQMPHSFKAHKNSTAQPGRPKVAILCEYDALPDIGHACGHSVSCACSLLAALALAKIPDLPLEVDLIGTPAEELGGGKIIMAKNGAFDGYDFAVMAHLFGNYVPYFKALASCDMRVTFHGQSSHASSEPWGGKNALNGIQLFYHALDMLRQHLTPDCQMHGIITNGGTLPSIVPDKASCYFYPRAGSLKNLEKLCARMENCARGAALATEITCQVEWPDPAYGDLYTGPTAKNFLNGIFKSLDLELTDQETPLGSTDAGNLDVLLPVFHPGVAIGHNQDIKLHSKEFADLVRSEAAGTTLQQGALIIAHICASLAYHPEILAAIKTEHKKHRQ